MSSQLDARFGLCGASPAGVFVKALDGSVIWLTRRPANSASWMHGRVVANVQLALAVETYKLIAFGTQAAQPAEQVLAPGANLVLGAADVDVWACWRPVEVQTSWGLRITTTVLLDVRADGLVAMNDHDTAQGIFLYRPGDVVVWKSFPTGPLAADAVAGRRNFRMAGDEAVYEEHGVGVKRISLLTGEQLPVGFRADASGLPVLA